MQMKIVLPKTVRYSANSTQVRTFASRSITPTSRKKIQILTDMGTTTSLFFSKVSVLSLLLLLYYE